jgi:hypothetical protein
LTKIKSVFLAGAALTLVACTQGDDIASPGPSDPGTPPGGGGGGGGGGGASADTCPTGFATGTPVGGVVVCNLSGVILSNLTLPFKDDDSDGVGVAYRLNGRVDVGVDVGAAGGGGTAATLTIQPGVVIFGNSGADHLVVNRGSQMIADGTQDLPIVFTSENDIVRRAADASDTGGSNISEWGGLVVLGRAPINRCIGGATPGTVDCEQTIEGVTNPDALYGGASANDDSGVFRYIQVRFAGFALNQDGDELNGLTLGGVGDGTVIEYVQVHNNSDDGIEVFGGAVNLKYIVLTGNDDESFDLDNGWSGRTQFMVIKQRDDGGDNGMELSSAGNAITPPTNPTIANFTMVGGRTNAFRINSGFVGRFINGVVAYDNSECFNWEATAGNGSSATYDGVDVDPTFNSVFFDCAPLTDDTPDTPAAVASVAADANNTSGDSMLASTFFPTMDVLNVPAFDLSTLPGAFFDDVDYIGAFSPDETETNNWATGWTFALFPDPVCPDGASLTGTLNGSNVCEISGVKTSDLTLTRGNIYEIGGRVDIGVDVGADGLGGDAADLIIEPGVVIFGNTGADHLVVNRGSRIFANGTPQNPVVFTSEADLTDTQADPINAISEWGGVVVLGRAPINRCIGGATPGTVDCEQTIEGVTNPEAIYGGAEANDDSGVIRYMQIKHAGFALNQDGDELNGLTLGGVGDATVIEYVQVHNNSDDGIEVFGGTVNMKNIVLTGNDDESFDLDNGWSGAAQFMIIVQRAAGGDNGMELSSAGNAISPPTNPTIANFTLVGAQTNAFRINSGFVGRFINGVVSYGASECFNWESTAGNGTSATYDGVNVDPTFNSVLFDCAPLTDDTPDTPAAVASVAADPNNNAAYSDTLINTFTNGPNETAATAFDLTTLPGTFFDDVDYVGAVEDTNDRWWAGWSCGLEASTPC